MSLDPIDRAAIRRELTRWGIWQDRCNEVDGYPSEDNIQRFMRGRGGGIGGHRILIRDMPDEVWELHFKIRALPVRLMDPIYALYVGFVRDDNSQLTYAERFERIGLTERTGFRRVNEAMTRLHLAVNSSRKGTVA